MIAKTVWKKEMEFNGYSESGHNLVFDAGAIHASGPTPMEAVLMALCACTSVDVVSILLQAKFNCGLLHVIACRNLCALDLM